MPTTKLDAVYFVSEPPEIFMESGLVHITFNISGYRPEFVMQPSVYLKARRTGQKVVDKFNADNVVGFKGGHG